jgi:glycosyltransferase involved in cell wall biosynthesis
MRVALVHDWLTGMRGGEKCLEVFCELFPDADLYALLYLPERVSPTIRSMKVHASWFNRLPGVTRYYRYGLPLFPTIIERFALTNYDLIVSSSHCVAKGIFPNGALHVAYVHSPMRYVWDMYSAYFGSDASWPVRLTMSLCRGYLQRWDVRSADRVHSFMASSKHIAGKIRTIYRRDAAVIHPPVDTEKFHVSSARKPFYLIVSALVPYKKIQLAIEAFNRLGLQLMIAGEGPLRRALEKMAGPNIEFLGWVDDTTLAELYACCEALIFPGEEDFGIVPLEAQASGRPVIAYGKGGATETVIGMDDSDARTGSTVDPTGIFFTESTPSSLVEAVERYVKFKAVFEPEKLRRQASRFSRGSFKLRVKEFIEEKLRERALRINKC